MLVYTYFGGLRATFFASYIHTVIIFTVLVVFILTAYATSGAAEVRRTVVAGIWVAFFQDCQQQSCEQASYPRNWQTSLVDHGYLFGVSPPDPPR